ncbi:AcrR family transcriptional regulator [Arthrobacter sp. CAN_A2]|uniref:TetR/AcrR family transcriptional regulator n=1 Tax=Arthrobacter sp. CAN_A2 TaxID=2787718 RepID=UPI0018EFAB58
MSNKEHILQTVRRLAIETGSVPSLGVIAREAGVSKGGLMHHFTSRTALVEGIAVQVMQDLDQALSAAAERGTVVETWLRLSSSPEEAALYRAMSILLTDRTSSTDTLLQLAAEAARRWEHLFAVEAGDPVAASIIRLLGDGMLLNSLTDNDAVPSVDSILQWLDRRSTK